MKETNEFKSVLTEAVTYFEANPEMTREDAREYSIHLVEEKFGKDDEDCAILVDRIMDKYIAMMGKRTYGELNKIILEVLLRSDHADAATFADKYDRRVFHVLPDEMIYKLPEKALAELFNEIDNSNLRRFLDFECRRTEPKAMNSYEVRFLKEVEDTLTEIKALSEESPDIVERLDILKKFHHSPY